MSILVYRLVQNTGISKSVIVEIVSRALSRLNRHRADVSVSLVREGRMRSLNRLHRGFDRPTDVLSFPLADQNKMKTSELGDVFLCPTYLRRQAKRFGVPYREEFTRSLIHGILHLAGYDHRTKREAGKMFKLQEKLVTKLLPDHHVRSS